VRCTQLDAPEEGQLMNFGTTMGEKILALPTVSALCLVRGCPAWIPEAGGSRWL